MSSNACFLLGMVAGCFLIPLFWLAVHGIYWAIWSVLDWFNTRAVNRIEEREIKEWMRRHPLKPYPLTWPRLLWERWGDDR